MIPLLALAIKERLPLSELFRRDGHVLKRHGAKDQYLCLSPFTPERTPSCNINDRKGVYYDFSTGTGGDHFSYYQTYHNVDFVTAQQALAGMAGLIEGAPLPPPKPRPPPVEDAPPTILSPNKLALWHDLCQKAITDGSCDRVAAWRGFRSETMRWAARQDLFAIYTYMGQPREAFLVFAPDPADTRNIPTKLIPISVHCRLAPGSPGNPHPKASWRFDPHGRERGVHAYPFVARPAEEAIPDCRYLFFFEGQWDALAFIDLMRWDYAWPPGAAVFGMRGQSSWRLLDDYPLHHQAVCYLFPDNDHAGGQWLQRDNRDKPFFSYLSGERGLTAVAVRPPGEGKDFNDACKAGLVTRDLLRQALHQLTPRRPKLKPPKPLALRQWIKTLPTDIPEELHRGAVAYLADNNPHKPKKINLLPDYWRQSQRPQAEDLHTLYQTYLTYRSKLT